MRVLVNALSVSPGGGATVALGLIPELARLDEEDRYTVLVKDRLLQDARSWPRNVQFRLGGRGTVSPATRAMWEQVKLPRLMQGGRHEVLLGMGGFGMLHGKWPQLVIVQNALFYVSDTQRTVKDRLRVPVQRLAQVAAVRRGGTGVCVSDAIREQLRPYVSPRSRLPVIPNGVDHVIAEIDPGHYTQKAKSVILWVGSDAPHKNPRELIDALPLVEEQHRGEIEVRLAGAFSESARSSIEGRARHLGISSSLRFTGYLKRRELLEEYASATVYVSTSEIEASPLPPVEAIGSGVPVVLTDIPAHREIAPRSQLYPVGVPHRLAQELVRLLNDPLLREQVSAAGLKQIRERNWALAAEAYHRELEYAIASHS